MYSEKKQNKVRCKSIIVNINDIIKIKASNTQFKTDKTRSEERPARRRYVLQLNCMLGWRVKNKKKDNNGSIELQEILYTRNYKHDAEHN